MGLGSELEHADRFASYVNELTKVLGHADREKLFRDYCAGLLATEGRRGVEPARPSRWGEVKSLRSARSVQSQSPTRRQVRR